ncbi:MAG: acetolactate synthase [Rhodobacterales bacterium]|nr:MAG: acetolactate synthase [Rhodobacterales bacterium]
MGVFGLTGLSAPALASDPIAVPSGQQVTFYDVIWEQHGTENTYRFRYLAPQIARDGDGISFDQAEADLIYLCENSALPSLRKHNRDVTKIIISISDIPVTFGRVSPQATQFIDGFDVQGIRCIWDAY